MSKLKIEDIKPRLISLGFGFYGESSEKPADPERIIIDVVRLFRDEQKTFRMLLAWLEKCHELVHVERLRSFASELSNFELRMLGMLSMKQVKNGDRRFSIIAEFVKNELRTKNKNEPNFDLESDDPYLIEKLGVDEELKEFGLRSAKIDPTDPKKILTLDEILQRNAWLRFRALIGANFRADLAFVMANKLAQNPYQAAKILGCSQETAYRLWKGLRLYPNIEKLAG